MCCCLHRDNFCWCLSLEHGAIGFASIWLVISLAALGFSIYLVHTTAILISVILTGLYYLLLSGVLR